MAADNLSATPAEEVVVTPDVATTKVEENPVKDLPLPPVPDPDPDAAVEKPKYFEKDDEKISQVASFKEETYMVEELPEEQRKALEELRKLVREALDRHELTTPLAKEEGKVETEEEKKVEGGEEAKVETAEPPKPAEEAVTVVKESVTVAEESVTVAEESVTAVEETVVDKVAVVKEESAKKTIVAVMENSEKVEVEVGSEKAVEDIKETIVEVTSAVTPPTPEAKAEEPKEPEEVCIWGIPLLKDERSNVVLLKFLRARDFKVKDSFTMLKSVVAWRKEFEIDSPDEESLGGSGLEKTVFMHGVDKKGHPVCYNVFGAFRDKELFANTFGEEEKRKKFLKWRVRFFEKSIEQLDMSPGGVSTFVQVIDIKNSPGLWKDIRMTTDKTLQLLQDNYPEFVAKQVLINVPWWYLAYTKIMSPFLTQRTKSKIVLVGPSRTADVLFKYIAPEQVPVQYGGLSRDGEQVFTTADPATEVTIKPSTKHAVEFPVSEKFTFMWEARVLGANAVYGAQFVPDSEESYTMIVQKSRKISSSEEPIIAGCFKAGETGKVVLAIDNQSSKKMKLLYRSKIKTTSD